MKEVTLTLTGQSGLLMHCDRFVDPLNEGTIEHKKLTAKRTKTIDDYRAIARSEWLGGLYWNDTLKVYVPSTMIRKCLVEGARLSKLGKQIERGLQINEPTGFPLLHAGTDDPESLYASGDFVHMSTVVISGRKLVRYRPFFDEWAVTCTLWIDAGLMDEAQLQNIADAAGLYIGIGDYRPNKGGPFGRFSALVSS